MIVYLLFEQTWQLKFYIAGELAAGCFIGGPLRNFGTQFDVIIWQYKLEEVLVVKVPVTVHIKKLKDVV